MKKEIKIKRKRGKSTATVYFMKYKGADVNKEENILVAWNWCLDMPIPRIGESVNIYSVDDKEIEEGQNMDKLEEVEYYGKVYEVDYSYSCFEDRFLDVAIYVEAFHEKRN